MDKNIALSEDSLDDFVQSTNKKFQPEQDEIVLQPDEIENETNETLQQNSATSNSKTLLKPNHFPTADNRIDAECEHFRQYLDETGTIFKLATTFAKLFQTIESDEDALANPRKYFLSVLGEGVKPRTELRTLKAEIIKLESNLDRILDENTRLRSMLKIPEPMIISSDEDDYDDLDDMLDDEADETQKAQNENELLTICEGLLQEEKHKLLSEQKTIGDVNPEASNLLDEKMEQEEELGKQGFKDGKYQEEYGEEFLGEYEEEGDAKSQFAKHLDTENEDDVLSDLLILNDSDQNLKYDGSIFVDHFSDSDENQKTSESDDDDGDYRFESDTTQSECVSDDGSDIGSECKKLEDIVLDDENNFEEEFQDEDDDDDQANNAVISTNR